MNRTFQNFTSITNTVNSPTNFSQSRHLTWNGTNVLRRTIQVTIGIASTISINTLVIDVGIIQQRHPMELLNGLTHILRHIRSAGQLGEVLLLSNINQSLLLIHIQTDLLTYRRRVGLSTTCTILWVVILNLISISCISHILFPQNLPYLALNSSSDIANTSSIFCDTD